MPCSFKESRREKKGTCTNYITVEGFQEEGGGGVGNKVRGGFKCERLLWWRLLTTEYWLEFVNNKLMPKQTKIAERKSSIVSMVAYEVYKIKFNLKELHYSQKS